MSSSTIVSPIPEGSARSSHVHQVPFRASATDPVNTSSTRAGGQQGVWTSGSNWGFLGDVPDAVLYNGAPMYRIRANSKCIEQRVPLICTRPTNVKAFNPGLYIFELVGAWPTDTVGVDNGVLFSWLNNLGNSRVIAASQGFTLYNNNGVLTFAMRGAVALQQTPLAGFNVRDLLKMRFEFRNATNASDASLNIFLNDAGAPAIQKTSADANWPQPGASPDCFLQMIIGVADAANYFYWRDISYRDGPDVALPLGM